MSNDPQIPLLPPLTNGPASQGDLVRAVRDLYAAIQQFYPPMATRIEALVTYDVIGNIPTATGSRTLFFATDEGILYIDTGTWNALSGTGSVTDHGALTGLDDDDHPQYIKHTEEGDFVQTAGNQTMAGSLTISDSTGDFFGGGIGTTLGLLSRNINMGIVPDTHMVSTSIPAGYTWVGTSGIFYGTPSNVTYGYRGCYLAGAPNGASYAHFLQRAVTNAAGNWQNKWLKARCSAGGSMIAGVRVDDGSDLSTHPFFELVCDGTANDGTFTVKMRHQDTVGGGITTTASKIILPVTNFVTLALNIYYSGGEYKAGGGLWGELNNNFGVGLDTGALSWMPCAGRAGIFLKADAAGNAYNGYWDFLYNEFV
jgi:hypothetical protein